MSQNQKEIVRMQSKLEVNEELTHHDQQMTKRRLTDLRPRVSSTMQRQSVWSPNFRFNVRPT